MGRWLIAIRQRKSLAILEGCLMEAASIQPMLSHLAALMTSDPINRATLKYESVLRDLSDILDVERVGVYVFDPMGMPKDVFTSFAGPNWNSFLKEYEQIRNKDPVFRCIRKQQAGAIDGSTLLGREGWKYSYICQWMRKWKLGHTLQGAVFSDGNLLATLNFARGEKKPAFSEADLETVEKLCADLAEFVTESSSLEPGASSARHEGARELLPDLSDDFLRGLSGSIVTDEHGETASPSQPGDVSNCSYQAYRKEIRENIQRMEKTRVSSAQTIISLNVSSLVRAYLTTILLPGTPKQYVSSLTWPDATDRLKTATFSRNQFSELPPRAQRVAELLIRGYSNKLIAKELDLSENTVKDHIKRIFHFYGITHRSQLPSLAGVLR